MHPSVRFCEKSTNQRKFSDKSVIITLFANKLNVFMRIAEGCYITGIIMTKTIGQREGA
jgi:hypothetical protein